MRQSKFRSSASTESFPNVSKPIWRHWFARRNSKGWCMYSFSLQTTNTLVVITTTIMYLTIPLWRSVLFHCNHLSEVDFPVLLILLIKKLCGRVKGLMENSMSVFLLQNLGDWSTNSLLSPRWLVEALAQAIAATNESIIGEEGLHVEADGSRTEEEDGNPKWELSFVLWMRIVLCLYSLSLLD